MKYNNIQRLAAATTLAIAGLFAGSAAQAGTVVVDLSGAQSINHVLEAGNTVWFVNIGAHALLTSVDWAVTLTAFAPSSLSEMEVSFGTLDNMLTLNPGGADFLSGTGSYTGSASLAGQGLSVGADGLLRIEFSEYTKDFASGVTEGQWVSGSLTFGVSDVPEPASAALAVLGLGALAGLQLRRARCA